MLLFALSCMDESADSAPTPWSIDNNTLKTKQPKSIEHMHITDLTTVS